MARRVAILGSTGSIGVQALDVVTRAGGDLQVVALSAARGWEPLLEQARAHGVKRVAVADPDAAARAAEAWTEGEVLAGTFQTWLTQGQALLLGLAVAILAPIGDLFESVIKRDAGTKDTGRLFGPHGGILDRADAALFTIVAGYYVWLAAVQ